MNKRPHRHRFSWFYTIVILGIVVIGYSQLNHRFFQPASINRIIEEDPATAKTEAEAVAMQELNEAAGREARTRPGTTAHKNATRDLYISGQKLQIVRTEKNPMTGKPYTASDVRAQGIGTLEDKAKIELQSAEKTRSGESIATLDSNFNLTEAAYLPIASSRQTEIESQLNINPHRNDDVLTKCPTPEGPINSGSTYNNLICVNGKLVTISELPAAVTAYCAENSITDTVNCESSVNNLMQCDNGEIYNAQTNTCDTDQTVKYPSMEERIQNGQACPGNGMVYNYEGGQYIGLKSCASANCNPNTGACDPGKANGVTIQANSEAEASVQCDSKRVNPNSTAGTYTCVAPIGTTVTSQEQCTSGYAVSSQVNGQLVCSACKAGINTNDPSGKSYFTCSGSGRATYHSCSTSVIKSKEGILSCSSAVEAYNNQPPTAQLTTGSLANNAFCFGDNTRCASGYCQKNYSLGIDIFAFDRCQSNPINQSITQPSQLAIISNLDPQKQTPTPTKQPSQPTPNSLKSTPPKSTNRPTSTPPLSGLPNGLSSTGSGLCQRVGNTYCDGERMYELYEWYASQPDAWWVGPDGEFTEGDFLALMLSYESRGEGTELLDAVTTASANQLWGTAEGGRDPYCTSQSDCTAGVFNFIGSYMQSAGLRYNNLVTTGSAQSISDGVTDIKPLFDSGYANQIADKAIYSQSPRPIDLNAPTDWGAFSSAVGGDPDIVGLNAAADSGRTGSTDPCGIYFAGNGEVVYSFNQKAAWEHGACRR